MKTTTHSDAVGTMDAGEIVGDSDSVGDGDCRLGDLVREWERGLCSGRWRAVMK
jgi:hypothetical protein